MGNPALQGTWQDEAINKRVRDIAQKLHAHTFERRLLSQVNSPEAPEKSAPSRKKRSWEED